MARGLQYYYHDDHLTSMTRKFLPPSRDRIVVRLVYAITLATAGVAGGGLLGGIAVGDGLHRGTEDSPSFAGLSANPRALVTEVAEISPACPGCSDSYGIAARLHAEDNLRMSEPFRRLGETDQDMSLPSEPLGDYHYGGRLPDPEPLDTPAIAVPVGLDAPAPTTVDMPVVRPREGPGQTPEPLSTPG